MTAYMRYMIFCIFLVCPSLVYAQRGRVILPKPRIEMKSNKIEMDYRFEKKYEVDVKKIRKQAEEQYMEYLRSKYNLKESNADNKKNEKENQYRRKSKKKNQYEANWRESFNKIKRDYWSSLSNEHISKNQSSQFKKLDPELLLATSASAKFIVLLPKYREYEATFGQKYNAKAEEEIKSASDKFASLPYKDIKILNKFTRTTLIDSIHNTPNQPIVIVAHSESNIKSRNIKLSDRTTISIEELHKEGFLVDSPVIVITCHGNDIEIQQEISIMDAYKICSAAIAYINSGEAKIACHVVGYMRIKANLLQRQKLAIKITILATIGGEVTVITFTYGADDD